MVSQREVTLLCQPFFDPLYDLSMVHPGHLAGVGFRETFCFFLQGLFFLQITGDEFDDAGPCQRRVSLEMNEALFPQAINDGTR